MEYKRFHEAKRRLRHFLIETDMSDLEERSRLLSYFAHRFVTFTAIFKEVMRRKRVVGSTSSSKAAAAQSTSDPVINTEIKGKFTLFNKNLYTDFEQLDVEEATLKAKKELSAYKKAKGIPAETQVFKVLGGPSYNPMRQELIRRGMVEHEWQEQGLNDKFVSLAFTFLYTRTRKDAFRL